MRHIPRDGKWWTVIIGVICAELRRVQNQQMVFQRIRNAVMVCILRAASATRDRDAGQRSADSKMVEA